MDLDPDSCFRALRTRDARFDGRFFTAVRTTGIYCRPICPARTPKRENCLFVACAAAAQEQGFRPCLRCRPEASPGTPAWLGTSATVSRALRLIAEGALDGGAVEDLAGRLGIGARQLRRLFLRHLGATPVAVAQTRRVLFAKKLIDETGLSMSHIALAAGFSSIRRFNDAIRSTYGVPPRELRRTNGAVSRAGDSADIRLRLGYRPPFDWGALVGYLAPRAVPQVEFVSPEAYRRTITLDGQHGFLEVTPDPGANRLIARFRLAAPVPLQPAAERVRRIFDLGADPAVIAADLAGAHPLRARLRAAPGVRVPGAWDGFELAVRCILGQQVTVKGATTLCGRLVQRFGTPLPQPDAPDAQLFPEPHRLAGADLREIGLPAARAAAISSLASVIAGGGLDLDAPRDLDAAVAALRALPGIGEWTAHYVAMRALREPDAFPASDLGLRRAVAADGDPVSPRQLAAIAEAWRPWRAYAAMLLWTGQVPISASRPANPAQRPRRRPARG